MTNLIKELRIAARNEMTKVTFVSLGDLLNRAIIEIETLVKARDRDQNKIQQLQERNDNQAETINNYRTGAELENLRYQLNEQYIEKGKLQNERNKLEKELSELKAVSHLEAIKDAMDSENKLQNLKEEINELTIKNCELQNELDKHTKYEDGVTAASCGHPIQCQYTTAWVDGGYAHCSMCDMKREIKVLKISNQHYKADIQKELQREQMINASSFQTIDMLGASVEKLKEKLKNYKTGDEVTKLKGEISKLELIHSCTIEQRTADWQRIKNLEIEVNKLKLADTIGQVISVAVAAGLSLEELNAVINKLVKQIH